MTSLLAPDTFRRGWTPYKIVEHATCYHVHYLFPCEELPPNAILFLIPLGQDGPLGDVRDAAQKLMFETPLLNLWRV